MLYENIELMLAALMAPEVIILWAMRQRFSAQKIAAKFNKYGWGKSHGFFVLMGGFALYDKGEFCGYLWEERKISEDKLHEVYWDKIVNRHNKIEELFSHGPHSEYHQPRNDDTEGREALEKPYTKPTCLLEYLVANGYITITEDSIHDKSKGDMISKFLAVLQTTWFLLQVVARAVTGVAITELEIVTVAFALLNFITYFLWWNKPLSVQYPIHVTWRQHAYIKPDKPTQSWAKSIHEGIVETVRVISADSMFDGAPLILQLLFLPWLIVRDILATCALRLQRISHNSELASSHEDLGVDNPLFISTSSLVPIKEPLGFYIASYSIAFVFGGIHCIPWLFHFPTHAEQVLWRISAVAVAAAPIPMGFLQWYYKDGVGFRLSNIFVVVPLSLLLGVIYIFARIILIILCLTALRDLPQSAYQTVQWTKFIPHVG
ncbi:hypothetical protein Moror_5915 [Moniliophthora roreri MCA 2997]|uniref:Uncharacterized protein n=1 Tax=Moniliophthora roreri (strain MCA 2997) TaxID=1381753 RepID=V2WXZ5_MONRO|nr:hypothetical protein Moror_5915 [Moniliophthora roreri MCA 2997]